MRGTLLALLLCVASHTAAAQTADPVRVGSGSASVTGGVVRAGAGAQPVRRAIVTLHGAGFDDHVAITDETGRFAFAGVPSGRVTVTVEKAAYLEQAYGATTPGGRGTAIALDRGQHVDVTIPLTYGAVFEGRVTSAAGEPLPGMPVSARPAGPGGTRKIVGTGSPTDSRGMFRIFGVPAGTYRLEVSAPPLMAAGSGDRPSTGDVDAMLAALRAGNGPSAAPASARTASGDTTRPLPPVAWAPVYFPGVTSPDAATPIAVRAGEERTGLDVIYTLVRLGRIEGRVSGAMSDLRAVQINLHRAGTATAFGDRTVRPSGTGAFVFPAVRPGHYVVTARANPAVAAPPAPSPIVRMGITTADAEAARAADADLLWASATIDVSGGDVEIAGLVLQPGAQMSGRLRFAGPPHPPVEQLAGARLRLSPAAALGPGLLRSGGFTSLRQARIQPDGSFSILGIGPGAYTLSVDVPAALGAGGWWARSAMAGDRDLLDVESDIEPGQRIAGVDVTLTNTHTQLSGVLHAASGQPVSDYFIVVFSTDPASWRALARRTQVGRPDTSGHFELDNLPAGDYYLAALTTIDQDELATSAFFERLAPLAMRLTLGEGEHRVQDLQLQR